MTPWIPDWLWNIWLYGSRYWGIPVSYFGLIAVFCIFALAYFFMGTLKEAIDNPKQNILW
ncbi:MAG TPA: hypothetical protein DEF42_13060 [Desulfosporosinus sp.]|nr:hypothetical protein [Desulfosporosinus sp.]